MIWRPMRAADLAAVEPLSEIIHPSFPEGPEIFAERLALSPATCFVLANPEIHGYLIAHPWSGPPPPLNTLLGTLPKAPEHLYIHDLALLPSTRGQGHGATIVARLTGPIALVSIGNARPFWQAQGFHPAPLPAEKLASYGPTGVYMRRQ